MKLLVTGGTGLIGSALVESLAERGDSITVLTRDITNAKKKLGRSNTKSVGFIESLSGLRDLNEFDGVINLAGEPVATRRWSDQQKQIIENSRWNLTQKISELINASDDPPSVFLNGSAIGYYGVSDDQVLTEAFDQPKPDFGHRLCEMTERLANESVSSHTRVCHLRTGVVLSRHGGALARMRPAFALGFGSPIASGDQYMSWIHIDDMISGLIHVLGSEDMSGPINFTAPNAIPNSEFSRALAKALKRPFFMPAIPEWFMKLAFGEMSELLIHGQNAYPEALLQSGYQFAYPDIREALQNIYSE